MHQNDPNYAAIARNLLIASYMAEVDQFAKVFALADYRTILSWFGNYKKFFRQKIRARNPMPAVLEATNGNRILSVRDLDPSMRIKFHAAHVAACCILFKDEPYVADMLNSGDIHNYALKYITSPAQAERVRSREIMHRINAMDSVRIILLLRMLGLVQQPSSRMYQLGLGAAAGVKDFHYVHTLPKTSRGKGGDANTVKFDHSHEAAADVILFDFDPRFEPTYAQYANDPDKSVSGYVGDTMDLLDDLSGRSIVKRNLITMLRVEPGMIPDTGRFLRKLHPVIGTSCDLVFSIGSGDTPDTYQDRLDLTSSLFGDLEKAGLSPVLIRLHLGGTLLEQAASLQYGSQIASSFEIIYCSLDPEKLRKTFAKT